MGGFELLLPLLILLPLLLITFRGRKQQKAYAETQKLIAPGVDVMTTAGLYGRILEVDGETVVLQVADGVRMRWAKAAIGRIVAPTGGPATAPGGVELTKPERRDG
jgi:preprotein translocase subunit YajC